MSADNRMDHKKLREAFGHFPCGVAAIAAEHEGQRHVIVASSFSVGVSLEPPMAAFFVQKGSSTWPVLARAARLGVSILSADHAHVCRQLAGPDKQARFDGIRPHVSELGAIRLPGAAVWFDCTVGSVHPAGDHFAVQLLIHDLILQKERLPLVFHASRFTQLAPAMA